MSISGEIVPVFVSEGELEHGNRCDLPGSGKPHRRNTGAAADGVNLSLQPPGTYPQLSWIRIGPAGWLTGALPPLSSCPRVR